MRRLHRTCNIKWTQLLLNTLWPGILRSLFVLSQSNIEFAIKKYTQIGSTFRAKNFSRFRVSSLII